MFFTAIKYETTPLSAALCFELGVIAGFFIIGPATPS